MRKNKTIKVKLENLMHEGEEALIFSHNEEFINKFTYIVNHRLAFSVHSLKNMNSFLTELSCSKYNTFYLDVDPIFNELDEILAKIQDKDRDKEFTVYFFISEKNFSKLEKFNLPKNITFLIQKGEDLFSIEVRKFIIL